MRVPKTNSLVTIPHASPSEGRRAYSLGLGTPEQPSARALDAFNQAGNFYAPLLNGFEDMSKATNSIARDMLQREAKEEAMKATTNFFEKDLNLVLNGNNGVFSRKGEDVLGSTNMVAEMFKSAPEKYGKNMSPASCEIFSEQLNSQRYGILSAVAKHEGAERLNYGLEINKRYASTYKTIALSNFGDERLYGENSQRYMQGVQETLQHARVDPELWPTYLANAKCDLELGRAEKFMETGNFDRALGIASNPELPQEQRAMFQNRLKQKYFSTLLIDAAQNPYELEAKLRETGFNLSVPSRGESNERKAAQGQSAPQKDKTHFEEDIKSNDREQGVGLAALFSSEDRQALFEALEKGKFALDIKVVENKGSALYASLRNSFANLPLEEQEAQITKELTAKNTNTSLGNASSDPNKTKAQPEGSDALPSNLPSEEKIRSYALELAKRDFALQKNQQKINDCLEMGKIVAQFQQASQGQADVVKQTSGSLACDFLSQIEKNQNLSPQSKARAKLEIMGKGPQENNENQTCLAQLYALIDGGGMKSASEVADFVANNDLTLNQGERALTYWQGFAANPQKNRNLHQNFNQACKDLGIDANQNEICLIYSELAEKLPTLDENINENSLKKYLARLALKNTEYT